MRTRVLQFLLLGSLLGLPLAGGSATRGPAKTLDVPFVPTPLEVAEAMLEMAKVGRNDVVYDLGSGDGRLVVMAAERYGARGVGIDVDPQRIAEARERAQRAGVTDRARFMEADIFEADFSQATVVTMYLLTEVNRRLQPRILDQLRPGARVVSHNYDLGDWPPDARRVVGDHTVYLWIVPARVAGRWSWELALPDGPRRYTADLEQTFQNVKGSISSGEGGEEAAVTGTLRGEELTFTVVEQRNPHPVTMRYRGRLVGGRATGTVRVGNGSSAVELPWRATGVQANP
jgi:SAM-dependent methyltransferase